MIILQHRLEAVSQLLDVDTKGPGLLGGLSLLPRTNMPKPEMAWLSASVLDINFKHNRHFLDTQSKRLTLSLIAVPN